MVELGGGPANASSQLISSFYAKSFPLGGGGGDGFIVELMADPDIVLMDENINLSLDDDIDIVVDDDTEIEVE